MKTTIKNIIGISTILGLAALLFGCVNPSINPANPGNGNAPGGTNIPSAYIDANGLLYLGNVQVDPAFIGSQIKIAAMVAADSLTQNNPQAKSYLVLSASIIQAAIASKNYDPAVLNASLDAVLPTGDHTAKLVRQIITDEIQTYSVYYSGLTVQGVANLSPYLTPILTGLSDGIVAGASLQLHQPAKLH